MNGRCITHNGMRGLDDPGFIALKLHIPECDSIMVDLIMKAVFAVKTFIPINFAFYSRSRGKIHMVGGIRLTGLDHRIGHARVFFSDRQELAVAQTACRSSKNTLARPSCSGKLAETMIKAD